MDLSEMHGGKNIVDEDDKNTAAEHESSLPKFYANGDDSYAVFNYLTDVRQRYGQ